MANPQTPTEIELLEIMAASDADYEAGRFVSGEEMARRIQAALARYEAEHEGGNSARVARRR